VQANPIKVQPNKKADEEIINKSLHLLLFLVSLLSLFLVVSFLLLSCLGLSFPLTFFDLSLLYPAQKPLEIIE